MRRAFFLLLVGSLVTACAASRPKSEAAAPQSPPSGAAAADAAPAASSPAGYPQQSSAYGGQPGAPPPPPQSSPSTPSAEPKPQPGMAMSRSVAIQQASNDIDSAQRELDVAGSSCQNACRALGSMDRAAGHLCQLTREESTHDRCDDAKRRLYGARDRVRNTCGQCPDNQPATDRNAPVPSVR